MKPAVFKNFVFDLEIFFCLSLFLGIYFVLSCRTSALKKSCMAGQNIGI